MTSVPPFPRRGVPIPKSAYPVRPEQPKPFFRTTSGRRMIFYAFGLVALAGALFRGVGSRSAGVQDRAASRPDSSAVALTQPPRSYVSSDVLHQLRTLDDFTEQPHDAAIAAAIKFMDALEGPESRPAATDWTDLEINQALAHPAAFRGGLVRLRGHLMKIDTRGIEHPAIPEGLTYRGWLMSRQEREDYMVCWETKNRPPDVEKIEKSELLELEGVFLQAIQYEDKKGVTRVSPFIVAHSVRVPPPEQSQRFLDTLFVPIVVVLIILVLMTTLFLFRKSRKPASASRYTARPPGPGR